jgi:ferritin-like metal-binding protein YciE
MKTETFDDLFMNILKATYYAEQQITKALPKMIEAASSPNLRQAFTKHLDETRTQVQRLDRVFQSFGEKPDTKTCKIIDANIEVCEELIKKSEPGAVRDAGLIMCGQGVEHYETVHYGTMIAWAKALGRTEAVRLLEETLAEEKNADSVLNKCALSNINEQAARQSRAAA